MNSALPTLQSLDNALEDAITVARSSPALREDHSTFVNVTVKPSVITMNDKRKKRKTASANVATSSTSAAQMSIQDAARKLHERIVQVAKGTTPTKTATSAAPPLTSFLSTRPTVTSLPSSVVMSSANTSGEESSSLSSDSALTTASSVREREPLASVKNTTVTGDPSHRDPADKPTGHQPSLYEAVFGPQIALELHHAAAASQPKTPPPQHASQGFFQLPATPVTPNPRTPRSVGMSARLHKLSCTPQLGSPERARRGGPPVGIDPHNSPTLQHLQREDEMAFSHPHQSYVLVSPSRKTRKPTSSPAMSSAKRQRLLQGHDQESDDSVIGMLASMAEERTRSRTSTPSRTSAQHNNGAFADPRSITPVKARVMSSMMPPNASAGPVTPPSRSVALPEGEDSNEANLLLNFANSPTVKQQSSARQGAGFGGHNFDPATPTRHGLPAEGHSTPSLLDSIERRKSRHRFLSANGTPLSMSTRTSHRHQRTSTRDQFPIARTLFEEEHVLADRDERAADSHSLALGAPAFSTPGRKAETVLASSRVGAGSSPITPPYSDRVRQNATMSCTNHPPSANKAKSRSAPVSAVPPFDTPPATPARQQTDQPSKAALARRASALGIPQTPEEVAAAWDASSEEEDADDEPDRRTKEPFSISKATTHGAPATPGQRRPRSRVPTTAKTSAEMERNGSSDTPRTPSPAPTISSEPRTPHTPNTSAFAYSEYINVSPSPNPRSRVMSAKGRFPSCNGHLVPLEDAMTWGEASARASGRSANHLHSTPTRQRHYSTEGTMLTPGPILYATSPTFNVRGESSKRAQMESQQPSAHHHSNCPTTESHKSVALPLDAGFNEDFGQARARTIAAAAAPLPLKRDESNDSMDVDETGDAATPSTTSHNVGLGLTY